MDSIDSARDTLQLDLLTKILDEMPPAISPDLMRALFRVFERFPEDDGFETFWSILHAIEAQDNYEPILFESTRAQPSEFAVLMVNRILNTGTTHVGDEDLLQLLRWVLELDRTPETVRELAREFVGRHEVS